jgi:aromatic-L-amino-acid decarboxylase
MTPDQFREHGHELVDWVADYLGRVGDLPVLSRSAPGSVRDALPPHPPQQPETFAAMLEMRKIDIAAVRAAAEAG